METIGFIVGGFAITVLGVFVPIIDSGIRKVNGELDDLIKDLNTRLNHNWPQYIAYTTKEKLLRLTAIFMDKFENSNEKKKAVHDEYVEARREATAKFHLTLTGKLPNQVQTEKWKAMSITQLIAEQANIQKMENTTKLVEEIALRKAKAAEKERAKALVIIGTTVL